MASKRTRKQSAQNTVQISREKFKVFVSSKMAELRDVREFINKALDERGIDAWIYEADAGARPEGVVDVSLNELEASDIYVGLFWEKYGEVTIEEFRHAQKLGKPCFIYIRDKNMRREKTLEDFLQAEVYSLSKGVGYSFFDSAVNLGAQVGNDIMGWVVRRLRTMTEEIALARVSRAEIVSLRDEVKRLQSISSKRLGENADTIAQLTQQLRAWFGTLGYSFESYQKSDEKSFEWIVRIPARRGFDRILLRGIEGEAGIGDVAILRKAVEEQKTNEGWLVTSLRVSPAARSEVEKEEYRNQLFCYTLDELLDVNADFSGYLNWLENEVKRRGIDKMYVPLACTKEELDPVTKQRIGVSRYDERNGWIEGYIDRWVADPSSQHISILGEFGTGKTWFALNYAWKALQQYQDAKKRGLKRPRLPLVISLRDYATAVTVESLFSEFFFRKHEIPLPGYSAFEELNRMGKLLLIFDGFDEMADRVDRQKMIDNFWKLAQVVVPEAKAVLTCRTEHFPEATEGRALLNAELKASTAALTGKPPQFEVLELEKFDNSQIRKVLSFRTKPATVEQIMGNPKLLDLARRPVMTELILEALPDIEAGKLIDLSRVYLYAIRRKMERDIKAERTFTSLADKLYFLCELSWEMLSTDQMSLNYRLFPERLSRLFGPAVQEQKDMDHWRYDMMAQTILIRNADGDYAPAHRSLLEFLVAYKFAADLGVLASDFTEAARTQSYLNTTLSPQNYTWSSYFNREVDKNGSIKTIAPLQEFTTEAIDKLATTVGKEPLSVAILDLLKNMLIPDKEELRRRLLGTVEQTRDKDISQVGFVGGNLATLLVRCDPTIFKGRDLNGCNLAGASFDNADLTGCRMNGANLQGAYFRNSIMEKADLRNADLSGVQFDEMGAIISLDFNADGTKLASGGDDASIRIWDTRTGDEALLLRGHQGSISCVRWDRDNEVVVGSTSEDRSVTIWNSLSGDVVHKIPDVFSNWTSGLSFQLGGDRLVITGGMAEGAVKVWNLSNQKEIWSYTFNPSQTKNISVSSDGNMLAISAWDRTSHETTDIPGKKVKQLTNALVIDANGQNPWVIEDSFKEGTWGIAFSPDDKSLFIGDFAGNIFVYDVGSKTRKTVLKVTEISDGQHHEARIWSLQANPKNNLLAAYSDSQVAIWDIATLKMLIVIDVVDIRIHGKRRGGGGIYRIYLGDITFNPDGTLLAGGFYDKSIRFWDVRPFIARKGELNIDLSGYIPPNLSALSDNPTTWPEWWQNCRINVPQGMIPNPDFGKSLRIVEQNISYKGLLITGAKGLDAELSRYDRSSIEEANTLGEWLVQKGAILSKGKRKRASKK